MKYCTYCGSTEHDFEWARNIFCKDLLCRGKRQGTEDCGICDECCFYVSEHEMVEAERIMAKPEPYRWIPCSERLPDVDQTTEFIVRDSAGIISGRLWHPGKGWGEPERPPRDDVAEWRPV